MVPKDGERIEILYHDDGLEPVAQHEGDEMSAAFPRAGFAPADVTYEYCGINDAQDGMSLREYFAAKALPAFLGMMRDAEECSIGQAVQRSIFAADIMITALNKKETDK